MRSERNEFKNLNLDVKNGYQMRSILGHGGKLELSILGTRKINFYQLIIAFVKDQNAESR